MKNKIILFAFLLISQSIFSQNISGTWYGGLDIQGQKLPLVVHISEKDNVFSSTFDSPLQGAKDIPIEKTAFTNNELTLNATQVGFLFKGKLSDQKISGNFSQNGMNLPMILSRKDESAAQKRPQTPSSLYSYETSEVSFPNEMQNNVLAGTLSAPKNFDKNAPILVMITGSGAQNRDEELFGHKPFLVIADDLAKKGIATLRLDDRGIGGSEKGKTESTTADFATDINSAVNYLVKNGYKNIGLIGHSEGGMIAPMVANENKNVKFLVLLAAPGIPIEQLMAKQTSEMAKISGASAEDLKASEDSNKKIYAFVKNYKGKNLKEDIKPILVTELRKLLKDQLSDEKILQTAENQAAEISSAWFEYFIKFNPDQYVSKIKIPVLALNGSLDLQVSAKENLAGIKSSLTKAGNKNFEIKEIEGLNHLFQTAATGNPSEYGQIEETFSPKALEQISNWLLKLKK